LLHSEPHDPQLFGSLYVSAQYDPQSAHPVRQAHVPPLQN
jgi:hypothetical protein